MAVVDEEGLILESNSTLGAPVNTVLANRLQADPAALLDAALSRPTNIARFFLSRQDGLVIVTAPVFGARDQVVGALFLAFLRPLGFDAFLSDLLGSMRRYLPTVLAFAGTVGALFGFLTARGLSCRLFALAETTTAWGHGDFSETVRDSVPDEIGHLSRQLNRMSEELQHLLHDRERLAALEERNRLARDLHDSVSQAMYAVTLYAEAATRLLSAGDRTTAENYLHELRNTSQEALKEMRLLIFELLPPVLQNEGLVAALQARLEAVEARTAMQTALECEGIITLKPEVEEGLYRIAREALNNAFKHAQAEEVVIRLHQNERTVCMKIIDDGIGFDIETIQEQRGLGLSGMTERAAELGGTLVLSSQPGEGTRVKVEVGLWGNQTSWGGLLLEGQTSINAQPFMLLVPAACVALIVLAFTFLGDGLRAALDPRTLSTE